MMNKKKDHGQPVRITRAIRAKVGRIAKRENRPIKQQTEILIQLGLEEYERKSGTGKAARA